ncbi:Putative two-component system sensor kinase [Citricoccus sp. K5]|nr:Putative two-component system sensor kinase [Citricoccus sp. K5]
MVLVATGWPILAAVHHVHVAIAMVLAVGQAAAVPLAVRRPIPALLLSTAAALGTTLASDPASGPWPWPVTTLIAFILLVLVVALRHPWRIGAVAWCAGALVGGLGLALESSTAEAALSSATLSNAVVCASIAGGALAVGSALQVLLASRSQLDHERQLTAEEETKRRELQQRNRIAQELHDVVAHSMSVISVQATTAPYRLPGMDEPTRGEFDSIADSSRRALTEMRGLLAILRGDDAADTTPQPTIADIPQLVVTTRSSGAHVELEIDPELLPLGGVTTAGGTGVPGAPSAAGDWSAVVPPASGLTAYRVVQEAISNALRHAPGAAIRVQVSVGDQIGIRIANGPAARGGLVASPGAGLGLKGIRERVSALGGTVKAGPTPEGGFAVKVRLPL